MFSLPKKRAFTNFFKNPAQCLSEEVRNFIIILSIGFTQGILGSCELVLSYIYKDDYRLSPTQSSFFSVSNKIPWMLKPLWGSISDNFKLFGYRRKSYILIMAILAWFCLLNFGVWLPPLAMTFILLLAYNVSLSFETCMAQAVLVQNAQKAIDKNISEGSGKTKAASRGLSLYFGARYVGCIISSLLIIFLFKETNKKEFMSGMSLIPLVLFGISFLLPEKRAKRKDSGSRIELSELNVKASSLATTNEETEKLTGGVKTSNFKKVLQFIKNPIIRKSMLLMFLSNFAPGSPQAKFYYYTVYLDFDSSFLGSLDFIAIAAILLALFIYDRWLKNIDMKKFYIGTILIVFILDLTQLIQIFRINVAMGISDRFFACLDTFIVELGVEFSSLPVLVLACKMCPKDIEATIFALMLSVSNAAGIISLQLGTVLTHMLGITEDNFDNLWILILTGAIFDLLPLTVLFSMNLNEEVKHEQEELQKQEYHEHATITTLDDGIEADREGSNGAEEIEERDEQLSPIRKELYSKLIANDKLYAFS